VAAGEIPIAIGYAHDQIKLKIEGANVEINAPGEGTGFELASMSLIRGGKQQIEARRLYDWILSSKNAQKIFIQWYVLLVANGAERHPDAFTMDQLKIIRQDTVWEGNPENRKRLLDRWTAEIGSKR
jgi:iron(III) transport system substrate-binding protein